LQGVVELFSPHPLFSVEFIMGMWFLSFVAASDTQPEPNNMKALILLTQIIACCALGAAFVGAAILLATFTHSY
jgi:NADH:ubiquinone oxidoreductase subunit K